MSSVHLKTGSEQGVTDRSLPLSQGVLTEGGSPNLKREITSEFHQPGQRAEVLNWTVDSQPDVCASVEEANNDEAKSGVILEGPQAEGSSAYKAASAPAVFRGDRFAKPLVKTETATTGTLKPRDITRAGGDMNATDQKEMHQPVTFVTSGPSSYGSLMPTPQAKKEQPTAIEKGVTAHVSQPRFS